MTLAEFLQLDLGPLLLVVLAGVACALPGNFLLLKRASLVGDTIAHAVLPGIVVAFILTGTTAPAPIMIGAVVAALCATLLVNLIAHTARLEQGASMALVFTSFFSLGVVLLEVSGARAVHIDTEHALMGAVENALWLSATGLTSFVDGAALASFPTSVLRVAAVAMLAAVIVSLLFKELKVTAFDPAFASVAGLRPHLADGVLLVLAAVAAVAAFDAVGAILTIALFVCPPATARLLTDRLERQVPISAAIAATTGVVGYAMAALLPRLFGFDLAVNAGGMVALVSSIFLLIVAWKARRRAASAGRLAKRDG